MGERMIACVGNAATNMHSVYLPPLKLDFNYDNQEWIQKQKDEVMNQAVLLFSEVLNTLCQIAEKISGAGTISCTRKIELRRQIAGLEAMLQKEKARFEESLQKTMNGEGTQGQVTADIFEINYLRRKLLIQAYVWDQHLIDVATLVNGSSPGSVFAKSEERPVVDSVKLSESSTAGIKFATSPAQPDIQIQEFEDPGSDKGGDDSCSTSINAPAEPLESKVNVGAAGVDGQISGIDVTTWMDSSQLIKAPDDTEDFASQLETVSSDFYYVFNENFLVTGQKLEALARHTPVYLSSFWELEFQDRARLFLPLGVNGCFVPVYDEEASSIIAYALMSLEYHSHPIDEQERERDSGDYSLPHLSSMHSDDFFNTSVSVGTSDNSFSTVSGPPSSLDTLLYQNYHNPRICFEEYGPLGGVKYSVTCYFAKQFEFLRRIYCSELDFVRSLSRCKKWGAQGGKSKAFFAKTLDDRFIIKEVVKTELKSFIKFAPEYFKYLSESIHMGRISCLAKILGIYQVTTKHLKGGKESKMDVLVIENLLFRKNVMQLYDLKGSLRSRYNADSGNNKVMLDQNLIEAMKTSPIFVGSEAKRLLERAVWNDTSFLASINVMDYSLLVGVDEEKHELIIGIIDFMRQFTCDKRLECCLKASGILGGANFSPTVIPPKKYKKRFRKAMIAYFPVVPDQWFP